MYCLSLVLSMGKLCILSSSTRFPDMGMIWGMGAYISPIPNPHLWERYIRYSYWGKLRYGVTAPYLSQNYSRKRPLCDQALKSFYSNHGHVKLKTFTLKPKRLTKNRVQYQSGKCTFKLENALFNWKMRMFYSL